MQWPTCASAKPRAATGATGSQEKDAGGDSCPTALFNIFTKLPFDLKSKLLPNLCNNSKIPKNKVVQNPKFYNFAFITTP